MTGSAPRPGSFAHRRAAGEQVGTVRDPAHQLLLGQLRRQRLRDGGEMERLRAAIAIVKQEMARMRGEWSPDDPSEWDGVEDGKHLEVTWEPTPAALIAQQQPPPFRHHATPFGQPKPSHPKFAEDEPRPTLDPQFHQVKLIAPERDRRLPAGFVLLDPPPLPDDGVPRSLCEEDQPPTRLANFVRRADLPHKGGGVGWQVIPPSLRSQSAPTSPLVGEVAERSVSDAGGWGESVSAHREYADTIATSPTHRGVPMPDPHPDELAFLAKIADHPDYPLPRLVFADWLEERGDRRAAWVRDDDLWQWMKPDAHDPIPDILAALFAEEVAPARERNLDAEEKASAALQKLEPMAVDAIRVWLQAHPEHWPDREVQAFVAAHPPAELRTVDELRAALEQRSWVEVWLAVVDLGFHGPDAASAITELMKLEGWDKYDEMQDVLQTYDLPVENAINRTLGKIGAAAEKAIPWLASIAWNYLESASEALIQLRADPDFVVQHLNDDNEWDTICGLRIASLLTDDPVSLLVRTVQQCDGRKAFGAVYQLGEMGPAAAAAIPFLTDWSLNWDGFRADLVRRYAADAIQKIRGEVPPT